MSADPRWLAERKAARAKAAERHRLAVLVCACLVALALLALWRFGPMPPEMLPS